MSEHAWVTEASEANFVQEVIERSHEVPVLVDFWADWCAPCKILIPVLLKLAQEYQGAFHLVKVDTEQERNLAAQHGIRSLPTLRLYRHGEVVEEVMGAQPEPVLRSLIDQHAVRASDASLQQALQLAAAGDADQALSLLETAHREDPANQRLTVEYARLCIQATQLEKADSLLHELPREIREQPEISGLRAMIEFAGIAAGAPPADALQASLESDPGQSEVRYQLAARQIMAGQFDAALDNLIDLLQRDRNYNDGAAQRALLAVFGLLGSDDERVTRYRRRMFALLH
jgi:putative thioredoxin